MLLSRANYRQNPATGYAFANAGAAAYVARLSSVPGDAEKAIIDTFFGRINVAPLAPNLFDAFYTAWCPGLTDVKENMLSASFPLTPVGTLIHDPWTSVESNGSTGYYLGPLPGTWVESTQNDAAFGAYIVAQELGSTKALISIATGSIVRVALVPKDPSGNLSGKLNATTDMPGAAIADRLGFSEIDRTGTTITGHRDGVQNSTLTQASSAASGQTTQISIFNSGGVFALDKLGFMYFGQHLTAAQRTALNAAVEEFYLALNPEDGYSTTGALLNFAPPAQSSPVTHALSVGYWRNDNASGRPDIFGTSTDVIITPNASTRTGRVIVEGGRHVRMIGGRHVLTENVASSRACQGVNVANNGSFFFEGHYIDLTNTPQEMDGLSFGGTLRFTDPQTRFADVYVQNCKILGINGTFDTLHSDGYQHDYGVRNMYWDRVDCQTNYQGVFMRQLMSPDDNPIQGEVIFRRCYFYRTGIPVGDDPETLSLLYFAINTTELLALPTDRIELTDVWVQVIGTDDATLAIRPASAASTGSDAIGPYIHWPSHPSRFVDVNNQPAKVRIGTPPGGGFSVSPGLSYVSPGYRS